MTDPDVTITDFGLAALCAGLAAASFGEPVVGSAYAGLFAALALAAFTGALWHGWFSGQNRGGPGGALWLATMLAVGAANLCLWLIAGAVFAGHQGLFFTVALGQFAVYALAALFLTRSFFLASAFSLPPTILLLVGFAQYGIRVGVAGLGIALAGAVMQAAERGILALRLSPNGLYHIVQAIAFVLVFLSAPAVAALTETG